MKSAETTSTRAAFSEGDIRSEVVAYRSLHDNSGGNLETRKSKYQEMVSNYYDLVTDFYEIGWGKSFHFAARQKGERFASSIMRHQHYMAFRLGLRAAERVLDVGCGVGGPMREIARFSGASIVGVNLNHYQVQRAREYNEKAGLAGQCELITADFMSIPEPDESFDAVYAFEATCHAPDKTALFCELYRLLRPGGRIGIYEWCLTDRYDADNAEHQAIKRGIEEGNGLPDIWNIRETRRCFEEAGFRVLDELDKAEEGDLDLPWFNSLAGRELSLLGLQRSRLGRVVVGGLVKGLETVRIAPKGTYDVQMFLSRGADALVAAGDIGIFTPMAFFLAEKS